MGPREDNKLHPEPPKSMRAPSFQLLAFDPGDFMQFVVDEELTEQQARTLLAAIWEVVVAFVDLGFGVHPVQQAVDRFGGSSSGSAARMLTSIFQAELVNQPTSTLATRSAEAKEDL